jgi:GT2 family glycosyltransferase
MQPFLSIVIKTFNEEAKIAKAIESALAVEPALRRSVEIVVADSVSADRTIDIACGYPVRVVQFENPMDRGCGAGVELGFQHATGMYIYFLDGDMELDANFVCAAVDLLEKAPNLAGVGGAIQDTRIFNAFDRIRVNNKAVSSTGACRWLEGGGLYRREAILAAGGYAADRNLKGYEEAELGMRLRAAGWQLIRLPQRAVAHTGHALGTWQLLARHWQSRRAMSGGVLLRRAIGKHWLLEACLMLAHPLAVAVWWGLLGLLIILAQGDLRVALLYTWGGMSLGVVAALLALKRDLHHVQLSIVSWHYSAVAIAIGFLSPIQATDSRIPARLVRDNEALALHPPP